MASQPSSSVMAECANRCKVSKGEGSGRFECSVLSCAWKAPRVLTGSLASTTLPRCSAHHRDEKRRIQRSRWLCHANQKSEDHNEKLGCNVVDFGGYGWSFRSDIAHRPSKDWRFAWRTGCASSYMYPFDSISPDSLWEELRPTISYLAQEELKLVNDALKLAFEAHDGQKRRSGEPFIIHPVEVARILGEHELDWESIAAGLLHDTVEDTKVVTFERIEKEFGATVRHIVEGETKVSKLGKLTCNGADSSVQDVKADDLRQMFLAMTEEVRVIIVKLADRLHNMRTLSHMPPHKQASIALETLQVFAPLAKLLGMYQIKSELEYLSFMYTNPNDFVELKKRVEDLYKDYVKELDVAKKILRQKIEEDQFLDLVTVTTEVRSVCKELYSVYKTVLKSKLSIHEINQIAQLRIIVKPKSCNGVGPLCSAQQICYHLLGLVHGIWTPIPRAIKDYIATPKPNGYQSLHTTVMPFLYESMFHLEVQIRTEDMDLIAERGIAGHYSGKAVPNMVGQNTPAGRNSKGKTTCLKNSDFALRIGWLKAIREWQQEFVGNMSSREFVDTVMRDLLGSRVFVFTPKGEIKNLPQGATVIDYAYMIHTEIGNNMVAAKVNGNLVSPMHVLANAEVVEIITYNALSNKSAFQRHQQWLQHAKTRSARHKIMKFLREQAALAATEITADAVDDFVADIKDGSENEQASLSERKSIWEKILAIVEESAKTKPGLVPVQNNVGLRKINGKSNKSAQKMSVKINGDPMLGEHALTEFFFGKIPTYKEVLPGLESWKAGKIALWHNLEGHSIKWFHIACIDRKGMMAEVTSALAAVGIRICSCVAEIDRKRGIGVMVFHYEGTYDNLVNACGSVDVILGVLGWSAGCSWSSPADDLDFL
ncbi:putative GTP diphosphokinase RSH1, chloroplastic isoform X1 [Zingiber officinale]|uniref:putative GTP diphosphokinase RSH1, chloroplastic isoform X1 n=2 Tax=Zingiber officinale TaxID=94328 RepID=UPI001C4CFD68|nr:putative GTP diphosphokinase RSH1, chloroplastic isoform X1 [Zingiber officinale]